MSDAPPRALGERRKRGGSHRGVGEALAKTTMGNLSLDKPPGGSPRPWLQNQLLFQGEGEAGMQALEPIALLGKAVEVGGGFPSTSFRVRTHPAPRPSVPEAPGSPVRLCPAFPGTSPAGMSIPAAPSAGLSPGPAGSR